MAALPPLVLPGGSAAPDLRRGSIFFVGTATVIIRYGGFTILTDPNFLHNGDHVDHLVSERLDRKLPILTTKHAAAVLKARGFERPIAFDTWDTIEVTKGAARMTVSAMPGKHAPGMLRPMIPPVMGTMLEFASGAKTALRLYITGDTLIHEHLYEIPKRFPEIDLALLHLGGTRIAGVLLT